MLAGWPARPHERPRLAGTAMHWGPTARDGRVWVDEVIVSEQPTVWLPPRIEADTDRSYAALLDYCRMGAGRSFKNLVERYKSAIEFIPPTMRVATLANWSRGHDWQARVVEYDRRAQMADEAWLEQKRQEVRANALDDAQSMEVTWRQ